MEQVLFLNAAQFVLILTRMLALFLTAPMFVGKMVPIRFRAFFALLLAFLLTFHQNEPVYCFKNQLSWFDSGFLSAFLNELFLGLALGGAALFLFGAIQLTGTAAAYVGGISFPVDGGLSNEAAPITASLFYLMGIAAVFLSGGHLLVLESLLNSFSIYPAGAVPPLLELAKNLPEIFILGFQLGVHLALPFLTVLLLGQIGMAILNRVLPQLDIFGLTFPVNLLLLLFILSLTFGTVLTIFQGKFAEIWTGFFPF